MKIHFLDERGADVYQPPRRTCAPQLLAAIGSSVGLKSSGCSFFAVFAIQLV
jgi:hypothetical protein